MDAAFDTHCLDKEMYVKIGVRALVFFCECHIILVLHTTPLAFGLMHTRVLWQIAFQAVSGHAVCDQAYKLFVEIALNQQTVCLV